MFELKDPLTGKVKRRYFELQDPVTGITDIVWLKTGVYTSNGTLAIRVMSNEGPYAVLTVNVDTEGATDNRAYVDVNNCPWAERFIKDNGLGEPTGWSCLSGFCVYPLYQFDLEKF